MQEIHIEFDREADGRYIAEATELPGVMTYGKTREEALASCESLADSFQIYIPA